MKIVLFDDHPIILDGLGNYFSQKEGVEVIGKAALKAEVIHLLENNEVDILVSDVMTDEELGLELFEEIQQKNFPTKVIVYSSLQGELVHNFLYEYGVVGIVNKNKGLDELWQLVELAYLTTEYKKKAAMRRRFRRRKKRLPATWQEVWRQRKLLPLPIPQCIRLTIKKIIYWQNLSA